MGAMSIDAITNPLDRITVAIHIFSVAIKQQPRNEE
jgi:hypothetical protein